MESLLFMGGVIGTWTLLLGAAAYLWKEASVREALERQEKEHLKKSLEREKEFLKEKEFLQDLINLKITEIQELDSALAESEKDLLVEIAKTPESEQITSEAIKKAIKSELPKK